MKRKGNSGIYKYPLVGEHVVQVGALYSAFSSHFLSMILLSIHIHGDTLKRSKPTSWFIMKWQTMAVLCGTDCSEIKTHDF